MKTPAIERTSAAKAGWVVILLFFGWLAFVFVPWPQGKVEEKVAPTLVDPRAPFAAKLRQAGLPDNPDWDGLPEQFAIMADKTHWSHDKIKFAYWNPGSRDYTYFFEAKRENGHVFFREIPKPDYYDDIVDWGWFEKTYGDSDYPFRFIGLESGPVWRNVLSLDKPVLQKNTPKKIDVDISVERRVTVTPETVLKPKDGKEK
jgi:hypothetical protein